MRAFEMSALNPKAPSFVPAQSAASVGPAEQLHHADVWYYKDENGNYQRIDGTPAEQAVSIDQGNFDEELGECDYESCDEGDEGPAIGEWVRVDGGYMYILNDESDGIVYPKPIRRSFAWANRTR
jgi:hypothetical protein